MSICEIPIIENEVIDWSQAACVAMTDLFFSEDPSSIASAKQICRQCPLSSACLDGAIERREPNGVWGGQLISNGRIIAYKRRRGRPSKGLLTRPGEKTTPHLVR